MQYLTLNSQIINQLQSPPSLRGDVNKVDRGELLTSEIKNLELRIKSTPSSAKADTSPQSREGLESCPSLRGKQGRTDDCLQAIGSLSVVRSLPKRSGGDVNEVDKGELLKF